MTAPRTATGIDAPAPHAAYALAPDTSTENTRVALLHTAAGARRTRPGLQREYLLRRAALTDRLALGTCDERQAAEAARRAHELLVADRADPRFVLGPLGPDSREWDSSPRLYVRQEYPLWAQLTDGGMIGTIPASTQGAA